MTGRGGIIAAGLGLALGVACGPGEARSVGSIGVEAGALGGAGLLEADAARAKRAGAGPLAVVASAASAPGDRVGGFVSVPGGACAAIFLRAAPTVADADLYLFEEDGSVFASDEAEGPGAALLACPPGGARLYAMTRVVRGAGLVSLGAMAAPPSRGAGIARALGVRGARGADAEATGWPGLDAKVRARRAALGGRWEETRRLALPVTPRATTRVSIDVPARRCVDLFVAPSEEIASIEVTASDLEGREVARAPEIGRDRALVVCAPRGEALSLGIRARASQGIVALVVSRSAEGAEAEIAEAARPARIGVAREREEAARSLEKALREGGYGPPLSRREGRARPGARTSLPLELPPGCSRIDVVAGAPAGPLAAELWDARPSRIASAEGATSAALFACTSTAQRSSGAPVVSLEVESLARPGPFVALLRREPISPAAWLAAPLAASRLLGRLAAAGLPTSEAGPAVEVALREGTRKTLPLAVPAGACAEIVVALGEGGSGVDLRLALSEAGEAPAAPVEARYVRGQSVASDAACAGAEGLEGQAELGLLRGASRALVLVRRFSPSR